MFLRVVSAPCQLPEWLDLGDGAGELEALRGSATSLCSDTLLTRSRTLMGSDVLQRRDLALVWVAPPGRHGE